VRLAAKEWAGAGAAYELASFDHGATTQEDGLRRSVDLNALVPSNIE
jgi:hypothetical protein